MEARPSKEETELNVFSWFLDVSRLPVDKSSVEKREPPEPDIRCNHVTEGPIAFELVEISNERNARNFAKMREMGSEIYKAYESLNPLIKEKFDSIFGSKPLSFTFREEAPRERIIGCLPLIFESLITEKSSPDGFEQFADRRIQKVLKSVLFKGRCWGSSGPNFNTAGQLDPTDHSIKVIKQKLNKTYDTDAPIELVAWHGGNNFGWNLRWKSAFDNFFEENSNLAPFRKLWILDDKQGEN